MWYAITYKAQRDKNVRELKLVNAAITGTCRCVSGCVMPDAKYTKELLTLKLKMMPAWWCCRLSSVAHQSSLSASAWSHHHFRRIMQPPPTGRHRRTGLFHPQREADHYAKTTGRNPEALMSSADRVAHIDGQRMVIIVSNTHDSPVSINAQSNKTEQSIYERLLGFCFNIFLRRHKFWLHRQFSSPNSRNEEMMGDGFLWCYCHRFVSGTANVWLSTSCTKQGQRRSEYTFFMVLFLMLFEVRRIMGKTTNLNNELKFHIVNIY